MDFGMKKKLFKIFARLLTVLPDCYPGYKGKIMEKKLLVPNDPKWPKKDFGGASYACTYGYVCTEGACLHLVL